MHDLIQRAWQSKNGLYYLVLIPASWLFSLLCAIRRLAYRIGLLASYQLSVPVIVIGNINVGGSGKTPAVIWLAERLKEAGYQPAIISRGYGAAINQSNQGLAVRKDSLPINVGDEPLLIARRTGCPVWVGADRVKVGQSLLDAHPECNVIISDDGLQHYQLKREVEIVIADEQTTSGKRLLPAGPLREPMSRLKAVDAVIAHGQNTIPAMFNMQLVSHQFYNLADKAQQVASTYFKQYDNVVAVAGIGKPERFFNHLTKLKLDFKAMHFKDHHMFTAKELDAIDCDAMVMTEKDAVKCEAFAQAHHWVLPVNAEMSETLLPVVLRKLQAVQQQYNRK